ncbi:hypothetical protein D6D18_08421 [Aureobasidium pullulans]|nr:hypothetical protein D6D18_08421 [Aureobasidium pullulans]
MQPWTNFLIVVVTIFAAFASASSATAISSDNATYVAPLIENCPVGSSACGKIKDKYLVMLREGYEPSSHLSYISRTLHVDDPVKEWRMMWHGDGAYSVHEVSADSIDILRRDPGVEEIEEGYWFQMDVVDRCRDPAYSEEERRQCYDASPVDSRGTVMHLEDERRASAGTSEDDKITARTDISESHNLIQVTRDTTGRSETTLDWIKWYLVIPINQRSKGSLAPLFRATSSDCRPDTYIVTLCKDIGYRDHFKTIGRNLEADKSTSFNDPKVEAIDEHEPWEMIKQLVPSERQNSTIQHRDSQPWSPAEWPKAPWHLQALSAGQKLDNIRDSGPATQIKYNNTVGGGQGVNIYIIDSGVDVEHRLFQGRARNFHKCYVDTDGECFKDKVGHGTAVAGCAGARFYGTAQGANIINVKTFFSFNKYMFLM